MKKPSARRAVFELILAGAIWGYGFIATKYALESMGPLTANLFRFVLSLVFIFPFIFFVPAFRTKKHVELLKLSIGPGLMLAVLMIFQTWGLKYTSATKSGFITTLYIVMVPIFEVFLLKKKIKFEHVFWVFIALLGTALICNFQGGTLNFGDFLTLICSIAATLHIILISKISKHIDSPIAFNGYQSLICAIGCLIAFLISPEPVTSFTSASILGTIFLALFSTTIAFMLQIRAQQVLSASKASLLFLLESPFAAIFGFVFLGEVLLLSQWIGGILILTAAILSVRRQIES